MEDNRLRELFDKWTSQSISEEETLELMTFLSKGSSASQREALVTALYESNDREQKLEPEEAEQLIAAILQNEKVAETLTVRRMQPFKKWMGYAAALLGLLIIGAVVYLLNSNHKPSSETAQYITEPLDPRRATLVLADGESIALEENPDSKFQQAQTEITNRYKPVEIHCPGRIGEACRLQFTDHSKGGQYQLELADGTRVWLNAATKLRYPAHFGGVTRRRSFLKAVKLILK